MTDYTELKQLVEQGSLPPVVATLIAENERLRLDNSSLRGSCARLGAEHAAMDRNFKKANRMQFEARTERDQLKAESEALRKALGDLLELYDTDEGCKSLPQYIAGLAAMGKGEQS